MSGLGSLFWGTVTGVLSDIEPKPSWIEYVYIYAVICFVLLLNGAVASSFPDTALLAPFMAGLGSWQSLILFLGTFHVASLKYNNYLNECLYSMITSSTFVTVYWALSCQDPLLLNVLVKLVLWVIGLLVYVICFILYLILRVVSSGLCWLLKTSWKFVWSNEDSLKNRLVACCSEPSGYQLLNHRV
ncbi:hypothetical protein PVAP13_8KG084484 [Panicum virgatum]|uniref:Uncharacterized protein n=1 Tax=Panicum virgatum TaxID=38727 RepID=A0A8T0PNQ1_PANVG|nr:hypothetical protein PVAP13_8KG084484 [Panicum virgatum]